MRGKAKMLLLPFNLVCLVLILASFFDKNVAINEPRLMATIQQNLIYALFPADRFYLTRYNFNEGKMLITENLTPQIITIKFWILSTIFTRVDPDFFNSKKRVSVNKVPVT